MKDLIRQNPRLLGKGKRDGSRYGKRHVAGEMNQTEAAFAELLQAQKLAGEIVEWLFEPMSFKYAHGARYTPDFMVMLPDGSLHFYDTKVMHAINEASIVRIKATAEKFWMFRFFAAKREKKDFVIVEY